MFEEIKEIELSLAFNICNSVNLSMYAGMVLIEFPSIRNCCINPSCANSGGKC